MSQCGHQPHGWHVFPPEPRSLVLGRVRTLNVLSAAASPEWVTRSYPLLSGDVAQRRFNAALRRTSDRAAYPIQVQVGVLLTEDDRARFPVSGESDRLSELQAVLVELIGDRGVLAGTIADAQGWAFILYTGDTAWLPACEAQFRAAASDHQVGFVVREDKRWRVFRELGPQVRTPRRDRVVALFVILLLGALAGRYGIAWAGAGVAAILAWIIPLALNKKDLLAAQLAHPAMAFAFFAYVLATVFFGVAAFVWHPGSPWACVVGARGLGVVLTAAVWPARRTFYARM